MISALSAVNGSRSQVPYCSTTSRPASAASEASRVIAPARERTA
jgi:hypothetical protein